MTTYLALAIVSGQHKADEDRTLEAWQVLLDSGVLATLPGQYGRMAQSLVDQGLIIG